MSPYFITIINGKTAVVTVHEAHDGGMVEFRDAVSGEVRGSAGIHWWQEDAHKVQYSGPLPSEDDRDRWIYESIPGDPDAW